MWLVANCSSQPSGERCRAGNAITPALLIRMCSGPSQAAANARTDAWSERSRRPTRTSPSMSLATRSPAPVSRTASVTSAPAPASARAVSTPIPDEPPVTIARLPPRSMPAITSAAVESKPNGVVMSVSVMGCS